MLSEKEPFLGRSRFSGVIAEALQGCTDRVREITPARWNLALASGADVEAEARISEDWLLMSAGFPGKHETVAIELWEIARANALLKGGAKFAEWPQEVGLFVRAELALDEEVDVSARIGEACTGFKDASELYTRLEKDSAQWAVRSRSKSESRSHSSELKRSARTETDCRGNSACDLRGLCERAEWAFSERSEGKLVVDLEVPDGFYQAALEEYPDGQVRVSAELARLEETPPPVCRDALSLLLLRASGLLRMARGAVHTCDGAFAVRFEVVFDSPPCAPELAHGLSALSVACGLHGREVEVLQTDERIAAAYLKAGTGALGAGGKSSKMGR